MTERDQSRDRAGDEMVRLTVAEATLRLGISEAGVRKRIQRNQIPHERGDDGRVWVWVSPGEARHAELRDTPEESRDTRDESRDAPVAGNEAAELVEELREQVRYLREQLDQERQARTEERRRHDTLMAQLIQRVPELEAPSEPSKATETATEAPERARVVPPGPRETLVVGSALWGMI